MAAEEQIWRNAAQAVLREAGVPLHYLDIKRMILEKGLIRPGLQTTLESVLFKDAGSPNARFKLINAQGMFALMTEQERAAHQVKLAAMSQKVASNPAKVKVPASAAAEINQTQQQQQQQTPAQILQSGKVKVIKIKRGPGRPRLHDRAHQNGHVMINPAENDRFRRKYLRLKKLAKKMLFINAAVCDEVSRVEDKLGRARSERKYLVKKLLNHQAVSEALCQMAAKQPQAAAYLGQSLGPGALSKLPVGIAGPLSLEMNLDSSPESKPAKPKKKSVPGSKTKKPKESSSSDEKPRQKKSARPGSTVLPPGGQIMSVTAAPPGAGTGEPGSGSLRHLLTTKTIMEPP